MSVLENALALRPTPDGKWLAYANERYEAINGMFGGWTAAVLLRTATEHPRRQGTPCVMTVNFIGKVEPRTEVIVRAHLVGGGRSLHHWQAELLTIDGRQTLAQAMVVFANRRETDGFVESRIPEAPEPDTLEDFQPPGPYGEQTSLRPVSGHPPFGRKSSASSSWVREMSGRAIDHVQLAFLSDLYAPRIFFSGDGPRLSATMTLSVNFLASDEELQTMGDEYILNEAIGTRATASIVGQQARLWSAHGALLATTEQLCWYR